MYVINIASDRGWKYGDDILFTRGPLGFLASTCGVGHNIEITLLATGILWLSQVWLLGRYVRTYAVGAFGTGRLLLAGLLLWAIPRPPLDGYLLYVVLLALSAAWFAENKRGIFLWACLLTTLQLFIMFASALSCCSAIGMFWIIWFFKARGAWRQICWYPFIIPIAFVAGYLLYNPSWSGLWGYLRSAQEIAGSYSLSMSLAEEPLYAWLSLLPVGLYGVMLAWLALKNRPAGQYLLLFMGCFWVAMKHGLVRVDMWHLDAAMSAMVPMFSLMAVFTPFRKTRVVRHQKTLAVAGVMALILLGAVLNGRGLVPKAKAYFRTVYGPNWNRLSSILDVTDKIVNPRQGDDRLPGPFLEAIGTNTIAFYPLELSFAAFNDVHFTPMPVLQAYTAYTPFLDACNARFFRDDSRAPTFVVMSLRTLDGRWPLIESPRAWNAIRENYEMHLYDEPYLLLKRRAAARLIEYRVLSSNVYARGQDIPLPADAGRVFISADLKLSRWGRIVKWFYHIPPVTLRAAFANGLIVDGRCIPDNLSSQTLVSFLPLPVDLRETADFIQAGSETNRVQRIAFGGPGLEYYEKTMWVTLFAGRPRDSVDGRPAHPGPGLEK